MPGSHSTHFRPQRVRSARELADALRLIRKSKGMTQIELAGVAGMRPHHISMIETGVTTPNVSTLFALFAALEVDMKLSPRGTDPEKRIEDIF